MLDRVLYYFVLFSVPMVLGSCLSNESGSYKIEPDIKLPKTSFSSSLFFPKYPMDSVAISCTCNYDTLTSTFRIRLRKTFPSRSYLNTNREYFTKQLSLSASRNMLSQFTEIEISTDSSRVVEMLMKKGSQERLIEGEYVIEKDIKEYELVLNRFSPDSISEIGGILHAKLPLEFGWKQEDMEIFLSFKCRNYNSKKETPIVEKRINSSIQIIDTLIAKRNNLPKGIDFFSFRNRLNLFCFDKKDSSVLICFNQGNGHGSGYGILLKMHSIEDASAFFQNQTDVPGDTLDRAFFPMAQMQLWFNQNPFECHLGDTIQGRFHFLTDRLLLLYGDQIEKKGKFKMVMKSADYELINFLNEKNLWQ